MYGQAWRDGRPPVAEGVKRAENLPNVHRAAGRVALVQDMEQPQADDFVAIANAMPGGIVNGRESVSTKEVTTSATVGGVRGAEPPVAGRRKSAQTRRPAALRSLNPAGACRG